MSIKLSCPSCNTAFALPGVPGSGKASCPRCGDVFPVRTYTTEPDGGPSPALVSPYGNRGKGEGRKMLLVIVVATVGILLSGLPPFIVYWSGKKKPKQQAAAVAAPVANSATELTGLGYLRPDASIAFAVRVPQVLAYAERTKQPAREVLAQAGLPDAARTAIEQLGVDLAQLDHIAGGITLGEGNDALHVTLAVILKQPLSDEVTFLEKLKAKVVAGKPGRYDVSLGRFPVSLARVSPLIWVFGYAEPGLSEVAKPSAPGVAHFRTLRTVAEALPADAAVWVAANDEGDWTAKPTVALIGQAPEMKKLLSAAKGGRGGSVAASLGEQPRLTLRVRTADEATGDRVRTYFATQAKELTGATSGGSGTTATFDTAFDANTGKLLQKMLTDAGK